MDRGEYCSSRLQQNDIHASNLHLCEFHFSEKVADRYKGRKRTLAELIETGQKFECKYASLPYTTYKRNCMHYTVFHHMLACKPLPVCRKCHLSSLSFDNLGQTIVKHANTISMKTW